MVNGQGELIDIQKMTCLDPTKTNWKTKGTKLMLEKNETNVRREWKWCSNDLIDVQRTKLMFKKPNNDIIDGLMT